MELYGRKQEMVRDQGGGEGLSFLTDILIMVICAQVLMVLVGQGSFAKYLRMFVGLLVLWKFTTGIFAVISTLEGILYRLFS